MAYETVLRLPHLEAAKDRPSNVGRGRAKATTPLSHATLLTTTCLQASPSAIKRSKLSPPEESIADSRLKWYLATRLHPAAWA